MAKDDNVAFTTPRGTAGFCSLKVGQPDTKFDAAGVYKATIVLPLGQAQKLIETVDRLVPDVKHKKAPNIPYEVNEEAGTVTFTAKMKAKITSRKTGETWTKKPALFDAGGKPITKPIGVYSGSEIAIGGEFAPWESAIGYGVQMRLEAVQVIELKEGGKSAAGFGFAAQEGGFDYDEADFSSAEEENQESTGAEDDGAEADF